MSDELTEAKERIVVLTEALHEANDVLQQFRGIKPGNGWDAEIALLDEAQRTIRQALGKDA